MPPLPAFLHLTFFDSLVVRTIHIPKGFLVMCNLSVIIANIWLTPTENAHQKFALVSRPMQIDLSDSRRQPQNPGGRCGCTQRSRAGTGVCSVVRALPGQVHDWTMAKPLSFVGLRKADSSFSDILIRPASEKGWSGSAPQ
jgi:hypothetical protein